MKRGRERRVQVWFCAETGRKRGMGARGRGEREGTQLRGTRTQEGEEGDVCVGRVRLCVLSVLREGRAGAGGEQALREGGVRRGRGVVFQGDALTQTETDTDTDRQTDT
eukprot:1454244-Rhodomonas_salina.2